MTLKVIKYNEKPFLKCLFSGELKKALKTHQTLSRLCISKQEKRRKNWVLKPVLKNQIRFEFLKPVSKNSKNKVFGFYF